MKLNIFEKLLVNNPARKLFQHYYEVPTLLRMGGQLVGKNVLEVGCGRGVGIEVILERFCAGRVSGLDLDPGMVELARKRLADYGEDRVSLWVGDAAKIAVEDDAFDAVFDFGAIHHIPSWQDAVSEIARVLKPGGRFFFEEATKQAIDRWLYRIFLDHPTENRFTGEEYVSELESNGIRVENTTTLFFGDFIFGTGVRSSGNSQVTRRSGDERSLRDPSGA